MNEVELDRFTKAKTDFEQQLTDMSEGVGGNVGNYAHIFAGMVRTYLRGMEMAKRPFSDIDALAILELSELAQQAITPQNTRASGLNASIYAMARASVAPYPPQPQMPVEQVRTPRGVDVLHAEMENAYGTPSDLDYREWEGATWPAHWTMMEAEKFSAYLSDARRKHKENGAKSDGAQENNSLADDAVSSADRPKPF